MRTLTAKRFIEPMRVAVFGLGYVGFTTMCCVASEGHQVVGFDVSEKKVDQINDGIPPIVEPAVGKLLNDGLASRRIAAFREIDDRVDGCELALVCVGTPSAPDGSHDMRHIAEVTRQIAAATSRRRGQPLTVAYRSTVRPGTIEGLIEPIFRAELGDAFDMAIELVYNPEFLREASAVSDYFEPPKIVIGTKDGTPNARMQCLNRNIDAPTFNVRYCEAEITKFVDNTWHAVKVAFANEIGRICLQLDISAATVHQVFVSDTKLNVSPYYLRPGGAFGGSCLPKDVRALQHLAAECGAATHLIDALLRSNDAHKYRLFQFATHDLPHGASVLVVGLAFKAGTDDLRESANVDLVRMLLQQGYRVSVFDPAIDATRLVGANLGYAYAHLPTITTLLVSKETAETAEYDRIVVTNATAKNLSMSPHQDVVHLDALV